MNPVCYASPLDCVYTRLYNALVEDALSEFSYDASVASLDYGVVNTMEGCFFEFAGYNDKLPVLAKKVLEVFTTLQIDPARFEVQRHKLEKSYRNSLLRQPYEIVMSKTDKLLMDKAYATESYCEIIKTLTCEGLQAWVPGLLAKGYVKSFVHGNMTHQAAKGLVTDLVDILAIKPLLPVERAGLQRRMVSLDQGPSESRCHTALTNKEEENSSIQLVLQVGRCGVREGGLLQLLALAMQNPCFEELRTKQQLGYIVFSGAMKENHCWALRFIVQSDHCAPDDLYKKVITFLEEFRSVNLAEMEQESFDTTRAGLISKLLEKEQSLGQENRGHWRAIDTGSHLLGKKIMAKDLEAVTKEDLLAFFDAHFAAETRRALLVAVHGCKHPLPEAAESHIQGDGEEWKEGCSLYPAAPVPAPAALAAQVAQALAAP